MSTPRVLRLFLSRIPRRHEPIQSLWCRGYGKPKGEIHKLLEPLAEYDNELLPSRPWRKFVIPAAIVVIVGAGIFVHYNDERRAILKGSSESTLLGRDITNRPAIGGPFKLFNTENQIVTEADLQGRWTLVYFGYTSSPDVGPEEVKKMAETTEILASKYELKISPIFITIDPQRDCPAQLDAYLKEFRSGIVGLTGSVDAVRQIAQEYRVFFKKIDEEGQDYLVQSSNNMYLLDSNAKTVRYFGTEYNAQQLADSIAAEMKKSFKC